MFYPLCSIFVVFWKCVVLKCSFILVVHSKMRVCLCARVLCAYFADFRVPLVVGSRARNSKHPKCSTWVERAQGVGNAQSVEAQFERQHCRYSIMAKNMASWLPRQNPVPVG